MEVLDLISKIEQIEALQPVDDNRKAELSNTFYLITLQFLRNYIGAETEFYKSLLNYTKLYGDISANKSAEALSVLRAVKNYLKLNLDFTKVDTYQIKIDIISDFVNQSITLINDKKYHPAASAILLGAALEEFLKQYAQNKDIDLTGIKTTIDPICAKLYEHNLISKQDFKDITSWAGLRNDASHGNFEEVNDRKRILNAIEGANLFMRKYSNEMGIRPI